MTFTDARSAVGLLAAAILLIGCTSSPEAEPEIGAAASSTTVVDGVGFETAGADQDTADPAVTDFVLVQVQLPQDQVLIGTVTVALQDVTLADAAPIDLERVVLSVNDLIAGGNQVEVFLPVPLDGSLDIAAAVHVDVDTSGTITAGDWISAELVLVTPETARAGVFVPLQMT